MKKHSDGVSLMNMLLCIFVLIIHLSATPATSLNYGSVWHILVYSANRSLTFAVPAFVFLSGYKLYGKYMDSRIDLARFFLGRLKKAVLPYVVAVLVFFVYYLSMGWARIGSLPEYILLGTLASHFYYIVIAVQFYLLFPLLKRIFSRFPITFLVVSLVISMFYRKVYNFEYSDRFFLTYVFYFVLGMFFSKYRTERHAKKIAIILTTVCIFLGVYHIYRLYMLYGGIINYKSAERMNLVYYAAAMALLFSLCMLVSSRSPFLCLISSAFERVSYNVYLYHLLLILILENNIFVHFSLSIKERFLISSIAVFLSVALYAVCDAAIRRRRNLCKEQKQT